MWLRTEVDEYVCSTEYGGRTVNPNNEIFAVICSRGWIKNDRSYRRFFFFLKKSFLCFSVGHSTGLFDDSIIVLWRGWCQWARKGRMRSFNELIYLPFPYSVLLLVYLSSFLLYLSIFLPDNLGGSVGTRNLTDIPRATNDLLQATYETFLTKSIGWCSLLMRCELSIGHTQYYLLLRPWWLSVSNTDDQNSTCIKFFVVRLPSTLDFRDAILHETI